VIGLSGLITPSLDEMVHVAKEIARQGFTDTFADRRRHHLARAYRVRSNPITGPTVYVTDACVASAWSALAQRRILKADFVAKVPKEYENRSAASQGPPGQGPQHSLEGRAAINSNSTAINL